MKTPTGNQFQNMMRFLILAATMTALTTTANIGCGSKSKNSTRATTPVGVTTVNPNLVNGQLCTNCLQNGNKSLGLGVGAFPTISPQMQLGLEFYSNSAVIPGQTVQGPILAGGYLWIQNLQGTCPIPNGEYTVTTTAPGQAAQPNYFVSGLQMTATFAGNAAAQVKLTLYNAIALTHTSTGLNQAHTLFSLGLIGNLMIEYGGCSDVILLSY